MLFESYRKFFVDLALTNLDICYNYPGHVLTAAVVCAARKACKLSQLWPFQLKAFTGLAFEDVKDCF